MGISNACIGISNACMGISNACMDIVEKSIPKLAIDAILEVLHLKNPFATLQFKDSNPQEFAKERKGEPECLGNFVVLQA